MAALGVKVESEAASYLL